MNEKRERIMKSLKRRLRVPEALLLIVSLVIILSLPCMAEDKELSDQSAEELQTSAEQETVVTDGRMQITEDFISLLAEDPELEALVEKSIRLAAVNNPDPKTNPVQSLDDYYDFLDWSATCMPWNILDGQDTSDLYRCIDQSLDYFYWS